MTDTDKEIADIERKPTKEDLRKKHGTPKEFADAIWAAWADLFITMEEAKAAIHKYHNEWDNAEEKPITPEEREESLKVCRIIGKNIKADHRFDQVVDDNFWDLIDKPKKNVSHRAWQKKEHKCLNCGEAGAHFVPPSMGEEGFYFCKKKEDA